MGPVLRTALEVGGSRAPSKCIPAASSSGACAREGVDDAHASARTAARLDKRGEDNGFDMFTPAHRSAARKLWAPRPLIFRLARPAVDWRRMAVRSSPDAATRLVRLYDGRAHEPPAIARSDIDANLLKELRIEGSQREADGGGPPSWLWPVLGVLVAVAIAGAGTWWFFASRPVAVQTAIATSSAPGGNGSAVLQATGYVTARRRATVSTQITGTLTEVLSQVSQAQAQLVQAQADEKRQSELVASGMVTKQSAEQARTAVALDAAQLDTRRREADGARAQLAQARVNFDYAVVRAPFSGVITEKAAQVGEIVSPLSAGGGFTRTGVGTIVDMDSLEVDVDVNEAYIGQVRADMPAEAVLDAYPDWKIPAHVIAIVPTADRGKATVKVRVALEQKDVRLVPDIGVRVSFLAQKQAPAAAVPPRGVLVPPQAIAERDGHAAVFVVRDGKALLRRVTPAAGDAGTMKLLPDSVDAGDRVILSPPAALADGAAVNTDGSTH
jgi:RND family efflux transporter MFP subunit